MSNLPTIDTERPWPGLLPFTEDARMFFHGRETETDDLFRLIERDPLTVLFGQSGLGKSSLLNAGVFPRLRRAGYLPVYMRLNLDPAAPVLIDQVWQALTDECNSHEVSASPSLPGDGFWQYLHRPGTEFLNPHGRPVVPVLAFDQFEEIFTLGRQTTEQAARTQLLLRQLGELIENRLPPALENELTQHPELLDQFDLLRQNIKIVFTFREDYLAEFEGLKTLIRPIMQNRMRLTPMPGDRAAEAIQQAGAGHLSAAVAARIVRFVGGAGGEAQQLGEISVEPALLSLVCRELNEQRIASGQAEISADLIQGENTQQIIADFYAQGFAGLDVKVRYFVEDRLLTAAGYRDSCALDNALAEPGVTDAAIQALVDRRILRREERGGLVRIELIHDVLALVAKASREARREAAQLEAAQLLLAKHRRRQRIAVAWASVLVAVLVAVSALAVFAFSRQKEAVAAEKSALAAQADAVAAKDIATRETAKAEEKGWNAVVLAAAADDLLDSHGTGEQLRASVDATDRLAADPPPTASLAFMTGVWHVVQGDSSTDVDWKGDGTCVNHHIYENGQELDLKGDICTWTYKTLGPHQFEIDWKSTKLGPEFPKQLIFSITNPTRIHNTTLDYDAVRIVKPEEELAIRRGQLAALQKQAGQAPGNAAYQMDLANGFDKLGAAFEGQNKPADADTEFNGELNVCLQLAQHDPAIADAQQCEAQAYEHLGDLELAQSRAFNQARNGNATEQQAIAAIASYQKSQAAREQLLKANPADVDAQLKAAHVSDALGMACYWMSKKPDAANAFQESVRLLQNVIDTKHGTPRVSADLVLSLIHLSWTSDAATARSALQKALAIATELQNENEIPDDLTGAVSVLQGMLAAH